jgi:hypothetical protein
VVVLLPNHLKVRKNMAFRHELQVAPKFLRILALVAIGGCIGLMLGNIVGSIVVPGHDWIADTVSDLAAGRYEIIQDFALYTFAATLLALGLASAHLHDGEGRWTGLTLSLVALAAIVTIIAARNEYGDRDSDGVEIHIYLVYLLGALFAAVFALMAMEGKRIGRGLTVVSWICLGLWAIGAPIFFILPTDWDGAWERGLGIIALVWSAVYANALLRLAKAS